MIKKIESIILYIRQKSKSIPFSNYFFEKIRKIYFHPALQAFFFKHLVLPEVAKVHKALFGKGVEKSILDEVRNIQAFNKNFDKYHSRDFVTAFLYVLVRSMKPEVFIETGISSGRSSTSVLEALEKNNLGKLYSIDLPKLTNSDTTDIVSLNGNQYRQYIPQTASEPGWLVPKELMVRWEKILGDSNIELPKLVERLSVIDVFFHDSDHSYKTMMNEFESTWPKIPSGKILLVDDVTSSEAFDDFIKKYNVAYHYIYNGLGIIKK